MPPASFVTSPTEIAHVSVLRSLVHRKQAKVPFSLPYFVTVRSHCRL